MSYASGIGSPQSGINSIAPADPKMAVEASQANNTAGESPSPAASVSHADETSLSARGSLVAQALNESDTRLDKVASLQQAIAAGTYSVSSSDVADKVLQSLLD